MRGLLVRNRPVAWVSISCEYNVMSSRGLCQGPIPRLEESYRLCERERERERAVATITNNEEVEEFRLTKK